MNVFNLKRLDCESVNDLFYQVEKETHGMKLPEEFQVQIAVSGLHTTEQSAISSHGPKTLVVRTHANPVQQPIAAVSEVAASIVAASIAAVSEVAAPTNGTLDQILDLLKTLTTKDNRAKQEPSHRRDTSYMT